MKKLFLLLLLFTIGFHSQGQEINYTTTPSDSIPDSIFNLTKEPLPPPLAKEQLIKDTTKLQLSFIDSLKFINPDFILDSIYIEERVYHLGEDSIKVLIHWKSNNGLTYFNMHDDENICVAEGLASLNKTGGKLVEVKHFGKLVDAARFISFKKGGKIYTFDPNRIFSTVDSIRAKTLIDRRRFYQGVHTLKNLTAAQIPTPAQCLEMSKTIVKAFADTLIAIVDTAHTKLLVTLHNNRGFEGGFSMYSYFKKGSIEHKSASDMYINPSLNLTGFYIVLKYEDFMHLLSHRCNVVLQNETPIDDGSLSVFAAAHGIDYMNIEAHYNNLLEQALLLQKLPQLWELRLKKYN